MLKAVEVKRGERRFTLVPKDDGSRRVELYGDRPGHFMSVPLMRRFRKSLCRYRLQSQLHHRSATQEHPEFGFYIGVVVPSLHAKRHYDGTEILQMTAEAFQTSLYAAPSDAQPVIPAAA